MPIEAKRLCGYRRVNALYLVGSGMAVSCDLLPLELKACPSCGYEIPFTRGFMWISKRYVEHYALYQHHALWQRTKCSCVQSCPMCYPNENNLERYGFMWVGSKFYSLESFIKEATEMGVSKRIAEVPKGLKLGETWVLLAHPKCLFWEKAPQQTLDPNLPNVRVEKPAIFYAFQPQKVEMLIWKSQATSQRILELEKKGITPIIVPDKEKEHA